MSGGARTVQPLACSACGTPFEAGLVFESQAFASCRKCGAILDLHQPRGGEALAVRSRSSGSAPGLRRRPNLSMPRKVAVREAPGRLEMTFPVAAKFGMWTAVLVGIAVALAGGLTLGGVRQVDVPLMLAVASPFLLAGAYLAGVVLINRVRVTVADGELRIGSGPLPWRGGRRVAARDVQQLYCEELPVPNGAGAVISRTFGVSAVVGPDARRLVLVQGLPQAELAFWLEQAVEHALNIADAPVGGEVPP